MPRSARSTKAPRAPTRTGRSLADFSLERQLADLRETMRPDGELRWPDVGLPARAFPLFSDRLDGFRNALYVLAGASRMGKTSFSLQLVVDFLRTNPEARGIFISLEQPVRELNVRLVAQCGKVNIEYLLNPSRDKEGKYEEKKREGLEAALELRDRLTLVDESRGGLALEDVAAFVAEAREGFDGPLIVGLDPLFKLRAGEGVAVGLGPQTAFLARELKTLCTAWNVAMVVTTSVGAAAGRRRPELSDLEEQWALMYDAHVVGLLYCDFFNDGETPFMEWEWGTDDLMVPIFELNVAKNKMGSFAGRIYYRFYTSCSRFRECIQVENENYDRMLHNLRVHDPSEPEVDDAMTARFEDLDAQVKKK